MNSPVDVVGEWYERDDNYVTKKTFVFLNEEDEEAEVMKQVDRLVQRKRREKQPEIARAGLPVGKSGARRRG